MLCYLIIVKVTLVVEGTTHQLCSGMMTTKCNVWDRWFLGHPYTLWYRVLLHSIYGYYNVYISYTCICVVCGACVVVVYTLCRIFLHYRHIIAEPSYRLQVRSSGSSLNCASTRRWPFTSMSCVLFTKGYPLPTSTLTWMAIFEPI